MKPLTAALARSLAAACLVACATASQSQSAPPAAEAASARSGYRTIRWEDLMPKDWDPYKGLPSQGAAGLLDGTPAAQRRMQLLRRVWDEAPTNPAMKEQAVRLPGYIVPLEESKDGLKEFLLVPYFGACIHTPPPPANQIIHVVLSRPAKGFVSMEPVWVSGTLSVTRHDSDMGVSGYGMAATTVVRYEAPKR